MDNKVKDIYQFVPQGYFKDEAEFQKFASDPKNTKDLFLFIQEGTPGAFKNEAELSSYLSLKKKESTQLDSGNGESVSLSKSNKPKVVNTTDEAPVEPKTFSERFSEGLAKNRPINLSESTTIKPTTLGKVGEKPVVKPVSEEKIPVKAKTLQSAPAQTEMFNQESWDAVLNKIKGTAALSPEDYFNNRAELYAQINLDEDQQKEFTLIKGIENADNEIARLTKLSKLHDNPDILLNLSKAQATKASQEAAYTKYKADKYNQIDSQIKEYQDIINSNTQQDVKDYFNFKIKELNSQKENFFLDQDQKVATEYSKNKQEISKFNVPGSTPKEKLRNYYLLLQDKEERLWKQLNPSDDPNVNALRGSLYALPRVISELVPGVDTEIFDQWQNIHQTIKAISPAVLINRNPIKDIDEGFMESFGKSFAKTLVPASELYINTPSELASKVKQSIAISGIPENAISPIAGTILSDKIKGPESFSSEWWGNIAGTSAGMIPYFVAGTELIKGASMLGKLPVYTRYLKGTKYGKYLVSEPVMTGLGYKTAGYIMPSTSDVLDEATFLSGFLGGVAQVGIEKVLNTKYIASVFNRLFGDQAENMAIMVSKVGNRVGNGLGEYSEEVGNTIGQMLDVYTKTADFNRLKQDFNDNFGTMSKNLELFVASFTMGAIMGSGTGYGKASAERSKDFYSNLSSEDKKKADSFVQRVTQERYNALVAAKKAEIKETGAKVEPVTQKDINDKNEAVDVLSSKESSPQEKQAALSVLADINLKIDSNKIAQTAEAEIKAGDTSVEVKPEDATIEISAQVEPAVAETATTEITEPKPLTNGTQVQMEPQIKGGMPRIMEFKDGTWFQKVGNELSAVSKGVQQEAQNLYDSQNKQRVSGEVGVGQEPIQTKPIEGAGKETPSPSGNVQAPEKVKESGEFVVQGTFNGHQVIAGNKAYEVADYRQIGQRGNTELVENTKGDKKIYTLVTPNTDAFNRRGYMGVSLVLPNTTTKTKGEIQSILEAKTAEVKANLSKERPGSFNKAVDMKYEGVSEAPVIKTTEATPPPIQQPIAPQEKEIKVQAPQEVDETKAGAVELKSMEMANKNVSKFLKDSGIEVNIMKTQADFDKAQQKEGLAAERGTEGMFISKSGKIYINKQNLQKDWARTILYHEATHPVINIIRNTNPEKYKALVNGIKDLANNGNKEIKESINDALNWAKKEYADKPEGTIEDEGIVEVIARIASGRIKFGQIEPTLREKLVEFINKIAKAIGLPPITPKTDTETFKKTARQVADAMRRGKSISKVVGKENVKEFSFTESTPQQRKDSESIAKNTEDKVVEGKVQPSMILNGAKGGQPINLYTGEASIEAIREFKPKMYISRALELSKTHLAKGTTRKYRVDSSLESQLQWADEVYKKAKETVVSNLLFIYDNIPSHIRDISKLWYDGANIIAQELSKKYDITLEQASAVIATQSPQKPWYDNVHLAHFIIDFNSKNQKTPMSQEAFDYYKLKSSDPKTGKSYTKQVEYLPVLKKSIGTKFEDLSLYDRAVMARTAFDLQYDRKAPLRLPNGIIIGTVKNLSSHSGYDTIAKGLSILQDGSTQNISANLGDAYKVRNFNNNIVNPKASNEVTIDTHAIAASYLLPLGSSSEEVKFDEATYGFFADAYREAAKQRGVLAREMQSITWEGARAIFPSTEKSQAKKDVAKNEWAKYKNGEESLEDVQKIIKQNGNDLSKTDWAAFINRMLEKNESTDYVAELPLNSGYKPAAGVGASERVASGLSSVVKGDRGVSKTQKSIGQREGLQESKKQTTFAQDETRRTKETTPSEVSFAKRIGRPVGYDALRVGQSGVEERGFTKTDLNKSFRIGGRDVNVKAEFAIQPSVREGIKANIPNAYVDKTLLEITGDPDSYHKFISTVKAKHPQGAAVYVYPKEDYADMRLFITPDGEAGVAIKPNGDFVSAFNRHVEGEGRKPNRLAQLMILGVKAGAKKADAFDTVLPNYYSKFGFRVVAKVPFSWDAAPEAFKDEYGNAHKGWDKKDFIDFNQGEPDVTFLVYDGGDRATIQDRIGDFDKYSLYKESLPESTYDEAVEIQEKALKGEAQKSTGGRNLAPNGKPSNLNEVQYKQVRTPEFKKWFGDWENDPENASKVVDENGEPLVVYHGSSSPVKFSEFDKSLSGGNFNNVGDPIGFYFGSNANYVYGYAKDRATKQRGTMYAAFLNIKNPVMAGPALIANAKKPQGKREPYSELKREEYAKFNPAVNDGYIADTGSSQNEYIAINPNQIKSAIDNTGAFSIEDNRIQMSTGGREVMNVGGVQQRVKDLPEGLNIVDGFYSPIEKRILEFKQPKASATKWKEIVGAKSDEAVFSGMAEWLNTFKPDQQISKEEVQDFIKNNRVEIKQVIKADNWKEFYDERVAAMNKEYEYFKAKGIGRFGILSTIPDSVFDKLNDADQDRLINLKAEQDFLDDVYFDYGNSRQVLTGAKESEMPKYKKYVERGNFEDYKEILVTAPTEAKAQRANAEIDRRLNDIDEELNTVRTYKKVGDSGTVSDFELVVTDQKKFDKLVAERNSLLEEDKKIYKQLQEAKDAEYRSSHYNEKNIIVHTRTDVRNDQNGDKLFFIEEVQSDWGQQGKKEGFAEKPDVFTSKDVKSIKQEGSLWLIDFGDKYDEVGIRISNFPTEQLAIDEAVKKLNDSQDTLRGNVGGEYKPSKAPYVTNTNAWVKLGLKIALQQAVQADAAKIAWTTGEQQNKRYDLSKQVDAITYEKNEDGTYNIHAGKDSRTVDHQNNVPEVQLESLLGKDIAQRIVNGEGTVDDRAPEYKSLTGVQLSVGGKGMTGFYGNLETPGIIGNAIKALVKELTGKEPTIEASALGYTSDYEDEIISNKDEYDAAIKRAGVFLYKGEVLSKSEAFDYLERGMKIGATFPKVDLQPSIEITPELKSAVEKGMAQFSRGERDVKPTFEEATDLFYKIRSTEGAAKKKALADERKALMDQNPSVKYIDDNIKSILDQLEKKEMATRKGNCP